MNKCYSISHIMNVRTLVEVKYFDGQKDVLKFSEINDIKERINSEKEFRPAFEVIKIHKFSHSKQVELFNYKAKTTQTLLVRENTEPKIFDLLEKFSFGSYINGRETKYKNIFLVYEALEKLPEYKFVAVRHAISHPNLTNCKTIIMIKSLFGVERIDLKKRSHNLIFRNLYLELEDKTHRLLTDEVCNLLKRPKELIGTYSIV